MNSESCRRGGIQSTSPRPRSSSGRTDKRNPAVQPSRWCSAENQLGDASDIRLPRGAVITGRITDELGDPVPNATVMRGAPAVPERATAAAQQRQRDRRTMSGSTESSGWRPADTTFRRRSTRDSSRTTADWRAPSLGGVTPSRFIRARPRSPPRRSSPWAWHRRSTTSTSGSCRRGWRRSAASPSTQQGRPLTCCGVSMMPRGRMAGMGTMGGRIPTGRHVYRRQRSARANTWCARTCRDIAAPGATDGSPDFSIALVTVNGDDVTNVILAPVVPATVSGRIVFDDPGAAQSLKPSALRVVWQSMNAGRDGLRRSAEVLLRRCRTTSRSS